MANRYHHAVSSARRFRGAPADYQPIDDRKRDLIGRGRLIAKLPKGHQIAFVTDSQDVEPIRHSIGADAQEFDAFFVQTRDGEYTAIWGIHGIFPALMKPAYRLR